MKLTFDQIKDITFGAVQIKQEKDGLRFFKCTDNQIQTWHIISKAQGYRSTCTTGIRLDLDTDSDFFEFEIEGGNISEVLINGISGFRTNESETHYKIPLEKGTNRVTLIFSSHGAESILKNVWLSDGANFKAHPHNRKILFVGDSITQGWNSVWDSDSYAWRITNMLDADSVINGIGGAAFEPTTFDSIDFDPDTVIVAYGTNDFGKYKTLDELREKAGGFLKKIQNEYKDKKLLCITPIWRSDEKEDRDMGSFADCRAVIKEQAENQGFDIVDGYTLVPHNTRYFADHVHPNALGFSHYAANLVKYIQR